MRIRGKRRARQLEGLSVVKTWNPGGNQEYVAHSEKLACVFITAGPSTKLFTWREGDSGGHVLRETTSRDLCGLVCPSRTSEPWGEGDCVKEGGGEEGEKKGIARGSVHWGCYYATSLDIVTLRLILNAAALDASSPNGDPIYGINQR